MFHLIPPGTEIDFVGKRRLWIGISLACILLTIVLFFTKGLNYGIDFTGGAEVQVKVPASWDIGRVRDELEKGGVKGLNVVEIGQPQDHEFLVKAKGDEKTLNQVGVQVNTILGKTLQASDYRIERSDVVGPAAGDQLRLS